MSEAQPRRSHEEAGTETTEPGVPRMPQNAFSKEELDRKHPSLEAVYDLPFDDLTRLEDDQLYSAGMKVVQDILREMTVVGRTRRICANSDIQKMSGQNAGPSEALIGTRGDSGPRLQGRPAFPESSGALKGPQKGCGAL